MAWTCPDCGRWFGKRQAHVCEPAVTADAWFAGRPLELRGIYEAVVKHVRKLGEAHIEVVNIGVIIKRKSTIAELRPKRAGFTLAFGLRRELREPRITRKVVTSNGRSWHYVLLAKKSDVDAQVRAWLTEAYATAEPG